MTIKRFARDTDNTVPRITGRSDCLDCPDCNGTCWSIAELSFRHPRISLQNKRTSDA